MDSADVPRRGEIWLATLGAARVGEPGKTRPVLVISPDGLRSGAATDLVSVVPISSSHAPTTLNPALKAGDGLDADSVAVVRAVRGVAQRRLLERLGKVTRREQFLVDQALILSLGLAQPG